MTNPHSSKEQEKPLFIICKITNRLKIEDIVCPKRNINLPPHKQSIFSSLPSPKSFPVFSIT